MEEESPEEEVEYEDYDGYMGVAADIAMMPNLEQLID